MASETRTRVNSPESETKENALPRVMNMLYV
jgi:hypothetical protein